MSRTLNAFGKANLDLQKGMSRNPKPTCWDLSWKQAPAWSRQTARAETPPVVPLPPLPGSGGSEAGRCCSRQWGHRVWVCEAVGLPGGNVAPCVAADTCRAARGPQSNKPKAEGLCPSSIPLPFSSSISAGQEQPSSSGCRTAKMYTWLLPFQWRRKDKTKRTFCCYPCLGCTKETELLEKFVMTFIT